MVANQTNGQRLQLSCSNQNFHYFLKTVYLLLISPLREGGSRAARRTQPILKGYKRSPAAALYAKADPNKRKILGLDSLLGGGDAPLPPLGMYE